MGCTWKMRYITSEWFPRTSGEERFFGRLRSISKQQRKVLEPIPTCYIKDSCILELSPARSHMILSQRKLF